MLKMKEIFTPTITFQGRENRVKYFKTEAKREAARYIISSESFKANTKEKFPFEQIGSNNEILSYGICPHCLNPIRLVGVLNSIKTKPHGRHTGRTIKGLPEWNLLKYQYCPYARKGYTPPNEDELLEAITDDVIELYNLLKNQFDRVIYMVQKTLHLRCSKYFWKKALNKYVVNKTFCYPWLTEANLPFIFAYRGMQQSSCFGQEFEIGTDLYKALDSYGKVRFLKNDYNSNLMRLTNRNNEYLNLVFRFTEHRQYADAGEAIKESFLFCIDDNSNGKTIFEKKVIFDETYFINLVKKEANSDKRQQWLLDIASETMPELNINMTAK